MSDYSRKKMSLLTMAMLCMWPFVSFLNSNQDDALIYGTYISAYAIVFLVAAGAGLSVICAVFGKEYLIATAHTVGIACVCFFLYLPCSTLLAQGGVSLGTLRILAWLVISICVLVVVWRASARRGTVLILFVVSLAMILGPTLGLAYFSYTGVVKRDRTENLSEKASTLAVRPNVYWFVFDAYPRVDVLRDYFAFDNKDFLDALRARAFRVLDGSTANFISTKLSISTTASMDYYLPQNTRLHPSMWTARLQGFNPVVEKFQHLGYQYVHAGSGGNNLKTRCGGREDRCIRGKPLGSIGINEAEVNLLRLTPLFWIIRRLMPELLSFDFISVEDISAALNYKNSSPQFVFAHVLSPHPPQRFDEKCGRDVPVRMELDGLDYSDVIVAYLNDLRCLNPLIIRLVDDILMYDRSDPYIVIQSDHGFRGRSLQANVNKPTVKPHLVAYANFNAIKLSKTCAEKIGGGVSLVNTFRIVLACIERKKPVLLPDRYFKATEGKLEEIHFEEF